MTIGVELRDDRYFKGTIDDVRIYTETIITDHVDWLFNNGKGRIETLAGVEEFYRIIDLEKGATTEWIQFNSEKVNKLNHLGDLPDKFRIEYKVFDLANNQGVNITYNQDFEYVRFSTETSITWVDDTIDLNSVLASERELIFDGSGFGGVPSLDAYINGFRYGTAIYDAGNYSLSFGTENNRETLIGYSDSLMSSGIYSNVNPINHISWEYDKNGTFGVVKHVLVDGDIVIINPLTYSTTATMELEILYSQGFALPNFMRIKQVYYNNCSSNSTEPVYLQFGEYLVDNTGLVTWSENSIIHDIYENHSEDVENGLIYFDYDASEFSSQLRLSNADGFFINFTMPAVYYRHTTIQRLIVSFNDFMGKSFTKIYFDIDLRKYFEDEVKNQYNETIFGLGKMMTIPLYINLNELVFSNTNEFFDLSYLESISFSITDSEMWPGSFIEEYGNFSVLNLPYQRVGIKDIHLYNLISDSLDEDEFGFVNSNIELRAPDYYNYHATDTFKIKRIDTSLTDFAAYHNGVQITSPTQIEYSDFFDVYFRYDGGTDPVLFNEFMNIPLNLIDNDILRIHSVSNSYWDTKEDLLAPGPFRTDHYFARYQVPQELRNYVLSFNSSGTPIQKIIINSPPTLNIEVVQEQLSDSESIYIPDDLYKLEIGDSLLLKGCVLDNDEYLVEDEVYSYRYQEAFDGETVNQFNFISPFGDDEFIDREEFAIYYINNRSEKEILYLNIDGNYFINDSILEYEPIISYVENAFLLNISWKYPSANFICFDTNLLITYKVLKGRPISPLSFSSYDSYDHNKEENLIEIPFARYDMITKNWITEEAFIESFIIDNELVFKEVKGGTVEGNSFTIQGPEYYDDIAGVIGLGIVDIGNVYIDIERNNTNKLLDPSEYSWNIDANGDLIVDYLGVDNEYNLSIGYYTYNPVPITHPIQTLEYIRAGDSYEFESSEYTISSNGYRIYFHDLYNSILQGGECNLHEVFKLKYTAPLTRRINLVSNLILLMQDSEGHYIPIDNIPIDNLGFFKYDERFSLEGPLSLPLGGKKIVNMKLSYINISYYNVSSRQYITVNYYVDPVGKIYPYAKSENYFKSFQIITIPKKVKIEMDEYQLQNIVVNPEFSEVREYKFNVNEFETLEKGEEYTAIQIDALVKENYEFTFKLTDFNDKPINNSIVWMHIGFMPKSETKFLNERAIIDELGVNPYYESLGTHPVTSIGPGDGIDKMFGKPLTYACENLSAYGPYWWEYGVIDMQGKVIFDVSFDDDYLSDYIEIWGSREGVTSIEDTVLYIRVFSTPFDWDNFAIHNPEQYICSRNGTIFNGTNIIDNYDFTDLTLQDTTYMEGLIRLHKNDIAVAVSDYISYDLPDPDLEEAKSPGYPVDYEPLKINVYVTEADPIPTGITTTLAELTRVHEISELEALPFSILNNSYSYYASVEIINPSGYTVYQDSKAITPTYDGGIISLTKSETESIIDQLGPGLSTIRIRVEESEFYKSSPTIITPLEIRPPNWVKFGEKNSKIDLIDPFIAAWGSSFYNETYMPFESNYPHLMGTLWIEPTYDQGEDLSVGDYVDINVICTVNNDDGSTSEFPLREGIMLRPGDHDGIMKFDIGLGPEDAFLMGLACSIKLTFDIDYSAYNIYGDNRDIEIYLLDLRLEENPSSSNSNTLWSIYDNEFDDAGGIIVGAETNTVFTDTGIVQLGSETDKYGIEVSYIYEPGKSEYSMDSTSELLTLLSLSSIAGLAVIGKKDDEDNYEFEKGQVGGDEKDWTVPFDNPSQFSLQELSTINFSESGNKPDNNTEFRVFYQFDFNFEKDSTDKYYGKILMGPNYGSVNVSWISFNLSLEESEGSYSPMYVRYTQDPTGGQGSYTLDYGIEGVSVWSDNFIIYNEQDLFGLTNKDVVNGHPRLTYNPDSSPPVIYGVKSQYELGYGFQKVDKPYSDSVRLIYNDADNNNRIINQTSATIDTITLSDPTLYIGLNNSSDETILELYNIPLLYAPEVNFTFKLDPVVIDQINYFGNFNNLTIDFYFVVDSGYTSYFTDTEIVALDYDELKFNLDSEGSYNIYYNKDLQSIYNTFGEDSIDIYIAISQVGVNDNYIPYIILEEFDYICDEHFVEMYDRMPNDGYGNLDVQSVIHTPHYFQIFSMPLRDNDVLFDYFPKSPFNLLNNSKITVGIKNLPYSSLVSLEVSESYTFNYLGTSETLTVCDTNFNMIPNLGLHTAGYNIDEVIIQDGTVDLYYGSGSSPIGEKEYDYYIDMEHTDGQSPEDYYSTVLNGNMTSWQHIFNLTDTFLTTSEIRVTGTVFYHELFDLTSDIIGESEITDIFDEHDKHIEFGIELPENVSVAYIRFIGKPYFYNLSIQGFPMGDNTPYCLPFKIDGDSNQFNPSEGADIMVADMDYSLEFSSNGSKYLLFYIDVSSASNFAIDNEIMVDYWAYNNFMEGFDYDIVENPKDPFISQIIWDFSGIDRLDTYHLHPDFSVNSTFNVEFSALQWDPSDINENDYIKDITDTIDFQPEIVTNISVQYTGYPVQIFDVLNVIPDNQFNASDDILFNYIYLQIWKDEDEDTTKTFRYGYSIDYINQSEADCEFIYDLNFANMEGDLLSGWYIIPDSYAYVEVNFNSTQLKYYLSSTPFNYDYVDSILGSFHIDLTVDGMKYDSEQSPQSGLDFHDFVEKIEDNIIYFNYRERGQDGFIEAKSQITVQYKYKLQPGLLESKHFFMVIYPWTNVFDTILSDVIFDVSDDSSITYRERYRKLSGSSIISPFEYSLSIYDTYSLFLSYRLNQRDYYEQKFTIDYAADPLNNYIYDFMPNGVNNYIKVFKDSGDYALSIYYYDRLGKLQFLDESFFDVVSDHEIKLNPTLNNPITIPFNYIDDFWVSFIPKFNDVEFESYRFSYDPTLDIKDTINVENWEVRGSSNSYVLPNINAPYFMNDKETTPSNYVCHATQIATYLEMGNTLSFNITDELSNYGEGYLLSNITQGNILSLYINTKIQNYESLEKIIVHLQDSSHTDITVDQEIFLEELAMYDFDIRIDLTGADSSLKYIELEPVFRDDAEFSEDNTLGVARFEFAVWNDDMAFTDINGNTVMNFTLDNMLLTNSTDLDLKDLAYLYNQYLEYLEIPDGIEIGWGITNNILGNIESYVLQIPNTYKHPENENEVLTFEDGDVILVRYNSPVRKGIGIGIGKMYFEKEPYNYNPSIPIAECLLINASDPTDYTQFMESYAFEIPLRLTPFDTEYSNTFKAIGVNISLYDLKDFAVDDMLDFTDIVFSVPDPSYELTIDQVKIVRVSEEPTEEYETLYERVWQYSELEIYTSGDNCTTDIYEWEDTEGPLFYGDTKWLDYLMIYDENYNYYSAGIGEDEHQLIWSSAYENFTWNPAFDRFQDYWGMEIELPMMVENNTKLYFAYCTNNSWKTPLGLNYNNIDFGSLEVIFDDSYYMSPKYEEWFGETVENSVFDYEFVQYYDESFTVYTEVDEYTYHFETKYSFEEDFNNTQVFKIVGLSPTFNETKIENGTEYEVIFDKISNNITITDLNVNDGLLNKFDLITVILNFSFGPVSSYSEIVLSDNFNETFLTNIEDTFYDYLTISFSYFEGGGDVLFEDGIESPLIAFESIDYTRNPNIGNSDYVLSGYEDSTIYINFEEFQDDFNVVFEADLEMDGVKDYKQIIDVNKDGIIDVTKYGVEDEENPSDIIWHTVIQDVEYEETIKNIVSDDIKRTKWFDIKDSVFSTFEFSLTSEYDGSEGLGESEVLIQVFRNIFAMFMPDMDFWAQKSLTRNSTEIQSIETKYYSLRLDSDRDGYAETEICYERNEITTYINVVDKETTIIAARPQNILNYLLEYAVNSWNTLFNGPQEDLVFNDQLTEGKLDNADEGTLNYILSEPILNPELVINQLKATYNKFTKTTDTTYIEDYIIEEITFTDWSEGEIVETRIYSDEFDNNEINTGITGVYTITDTTTGQQISVSADSSLFITEPLSTGLEIETWSEDDVPVIFDSKTTINELRIENENYFEKTITLRIQNRFSLYNDIYKTSDPTDGGNVEFTVSGMVITPPDGMVYYTSDKELFKLGYAKTQGHYFYYDSDGNGFYETVYILAVGKDEDIYPVETDYLSLGYLGYLSSFVPTYDVIAIGYNYDGKHDFAPYERVDIYDPDIDDTDFDNLKQELPRKYAQNWNYDFSKLEDYELLFPVDDYDGFEPKDHIFEITKLTEMHDLYNTELFYEVRERVYEDAWEIYREQMWTDVWDQVFMMVTSTAVSAPFKLIPVVGEAISIAVYIGVYGLLTKFNIDFKAHEAETEQRSQTFLPEGGQMQPTKLNDRTFVDNVLLLGDSMPAALMGHPGAYYTTIMGGEVGNMYTAEAIASPPNGYRFLVSLSPINIFGDIAYAFTLNPDQMYQMSFDNINLDYELITSELYSYNNRPYYHYSSFATRDSLHAQYANNTIGYLEQRIREETDNELNTIKPVIIDGRPQYIFVDGENDLHQKTLPEFYLNSPIIVSQSRYNELASADTSLVSGNLFVDIKSSFTADTEGIDSHNLLDLEKELGYKTKIPLSEGEFNYPINFVTVEVIRKTMLITTIVIDVGVSTTTSYFEDSLKKVEIPSSYYTLNYGNLYFTQDFEDIIFENKQEFDNLIGSSSYHSVFYRIRVNFARIIPDSGSDEEQRIGLAQSSSYAIRDYFNQYTFACTTAQMISEIGYTEIMTLISTLISTPFILAGQWAVQGLKQAAEEGSKLTVKTALSQLFSKAILKEIVKAPVKEALEEIVTDGFIEAFFGNLVSMTTGNEDLSFWVTSLMTSARESASGPGRGGMQFDFDSAMYYSSDFRKQYSQAWALAERSGTIDERAFREEFKERMEKIYGVQQDSDTQSEAERSSWKKLIGSRAFKIFGGFAAISLGSINLLTAFNTFKSYTTSIMEAPSKISRTVTQFKNRKKASVVYSTISDVIPKVKTVKPLLDFVMLRTAFEGIDPSDPTISMTLLSLDIISQYADPKNTFEKSSVDALVFNKMASGGFELGITDSLAGLQDKIVELPDFSPVKELIERNLERAAEIDNSLKITELAEKRNKDNIPIPDNVYVAALPSQIITPQSDYVGVKWNNEEESLPKEGRVIDIISILTSKYQFQLESGETFQLKYGDIIVSTGDYLYMELKDIVDRLGGTYEFSIEIVSSKENKLEEIFKNLMNMIIFSDNCKYLIKDKKERFYKIFDINNDRKLRDVYDFVKDMDIIIREIMANHPLDYVKTRLIQDWTSIESLTSSHKLLLKKEAIRFYNDHLFDVFMGREKTNKLAIYKNIQKRIMRSLFEINNLHKKVKGADYEKLFRGLKDNLDNIRSLSVKEIDFDTIFYISVLDSILDVKSFIYEIGKVTPVFSTSKGINTGLDLEGFSIRNLLPLEILYYSEKGFDLKGYEFVKFHDSSAQKELTKLFGPAEYYHRKDISLFDVKGRHVYIHTDGNVYIVGTPSKNIQSKTTFHSIDIGVDGFRNILETSLDIVRDSFNVERTLTMENTITEVVFNSPLSNLRYDDIISQAKEALKEWTKVKGFSDDYWKTCSSSDFWKYKKVNEINTYVWTFLQLNNLEFNLENFREVFQRDIKRFYTKVTKKITKEQKFVESLSENFASFWGIYYDENLNAKFGLKIDGNIDTYLSPLKGEFNTYLYEDDLPIEIYSKEKGVNNIFGAKWKTDEENKNYLEGVYILVYKIIKVKDSVSFEYGLQRIDNLNEIFDIHPEYDWNFGYPIKKGDGWEDLPPILLTDLNSQRLFGRINFQDQKIVDLGENWIDNYNNLIEDSQIFKKDKNGNDYSYAIRIINFYRTVYGNKYHFIRSRTDITNQYLKYGMRYPLALKLFPELETIPKSSRQELKLAKSVKLKKIKANLLGDNINDYTLYEIYLRTIDNRRNLAIPVSKIPRYNSFIMDKLGPLNMRYDGMNRPILESARVKSDIEGILNLLKDIDDGENGPKGINFMNKFCFRDLNGNEDLYSIKTWMGILYKKIMAFNKGSSIDRTLLLIDRAKTRLSNLDLPSEYFDTNKFSSIEIEKGIIIFEILQDLLGHATIRFNLFGMFEFYIGSGNNFKIGILDMYNNRELSKRLKYFSFISPTQYTYVGGLSKGRIEEHNFPLFFLDSFLYLPITTSKNSEKNRAYFPFTPLAFTFSEFTVNSFDFKLFCTKINNDFISGYNNYISRFYPDNDLVRLTHFCKTQQFVMKMLRKKIINKVRANLNKDNMISNKNDYIEYLLRRTRDELFVSYIFRDGDAPGFIRKQLEDFLASKDYSMKLIFYPTLKNQDPSGPNSFELQLTKDDFNGLSFISWGNNLDFANTEIINSYMEDNFYEQWNEMVTLTDQERINE